MKFKSLVLFILLAMLWSCKPDIENFSPSKGTADFTKYIAIGNSTTAGYADGALYRQGQIYSYPNMLAEQFKKAGGGEFTQPLMLDELGFGGKRVLGYVTDCAGNTSLSPTLASGTPNPQNFASIADQGPFNNMGVPGAKSFHLLAPGYGQMNPYFGRFASSASTSIIADALAQQATFFTLWIGNNDVLTYAMAGGESDSITNPVAYGQYMGLILQQLTANGAKGAIANIPDITSLPFFNTIPAYGLALTSQAQVDQLNTAYTPYNAGADQLGVPHISFSLGANPFVIQDNTPPYNLLGGLRQIKQGELLTLYLPQDSLKCAYWGSAKPIPAQYVLDKVEIDAISAAITSYNQTITTLASQFNLALVDLNSKLKGAKTGLVYDGLRFTATFVTGGFFSLDGVHFNPQGNAIVANYFIDAINQQYQAKIPKINITKYPGIVFP